METIYFKMTSCIFNFKTLHFNFELVVHQSAIIVFTDVDIKGCRFHLGQAWWRKVRELCNKFNYYNLTIFILQIFQLNIIFQIQSEKS